MDTTHTTEDADEHTKCSADRSRKSAITIENNPLIDADTEELTVEQNQRNAENPKHYVERGIQSMNDDVFVECKDGPMAALEKSYKEEIITQTIEQNGTKSDEKETNNNNTKSNIENQCPEGGNESDTDNNEILNITKSLNSNNTNNGEYLNSSRIDANDAETETVIKDRNHIQITPNDNEILYDETKPKRIQNPNKLKISVPPEGSKLVLEGIDRLISPDETSPVKRSPHRRRNASVEKPVYENAARGRPIVVYDEAEEDDEKRANLKYPAEQCVSKQSSQEQSCETRSLQVPDSGLNVHRDHYQKSPDIQRKFHSSEFDGRGDLIRRSESPVLRLKNRSESAQCYSKYGRKISSDARLGGTSTKDSVVKRDPIRKISSHARLENVEESRNDLRQTDEPKQRRVSFGVTTIHNVENGPTDKAGSRNIPEIIYPHRYDNSPIRIDNRNKHQSDIVLDVNSKDSKAHAHQTQKYMSEDVEIRVENANHNGPLPPQEEIEMQPTELCLNEQYDNKAFIDDEHVLETQNHSSLPKIIDSQTGTPMEVRKNFSSNSLNSSTESLIQFQANKTLNKLPKEKKLSTHSLPCESTKGHGHDKKKARHSDVNGLPKSILKVKTDDSVSNASTESVKGKKHSSKRDSIVLYHDRNGDLIVDGAKPDRGSWVGISRNDFKRLWDSRYDLLARYKVHVAVFCVFLLTLIFVIVGVQLHKKEKTTGRTSRDTLIFDPDFRRIHLFDEDELDEIVGTLGMEIPEGVSASNCYLNFEKGQDVKCLSWEEHAELTIVHKQYNKTQCYNIRWTINPGVNLHDCYDTDGAYWFGPVNSSFSQWPLKHSGFSFDSLSPLVSGTFSTVTELLWLSSKGAAIVIDPNFPVYISWNERNGETFCISRSYRESSFPHTLNSNRPVQYTICNGVNILETYRLVRNNFFPKLSQMPDKVLLNSPHWSALPESESFTVNDTMIMEVASNIVDNGFECGSIEIDGQWGKKYGDFSFDKTAFSNIENVLKYVASTSCGLSVAVYPYVNYLSENFKPGLVNGYFVKSTGGNAPALLQWEHGVGAMIDVAGANAEDWFSSILREFTTTNSITTLRFGYGNSVWLPSNAEFHSEQLFPYQILKLYSKFIDSFGNVIFDRTSQTQGIPSLISVPSSIIHKDDRKCLKNIIPHFLTVGMLGYPFIISDGFEYKQKSNLNGADIPSRDLFIRWMQLSTYFPAMKYTVKPWQYDEEVTTISKSLSKYHQDTVLMIVDSLRDQILSGEPILRPMWWSDPTDENAFTIDDQFLLGSDMMVAPVLCEGESGVAERNIYFTKGIWRDSLSNILIQGPKWVQYYKVTQTQIPVFKKEVLFETET